MVTAVRRARGGRLAECCSCAGSTAAKCEMRNAECRMADAKCEMRNAKRQMSYVQWRMPNVKCQTSNVNVGAPRDITVRLQTEASRAMTAQAPTPTRFVFLPCCVVIAAPNGRLVMSCPILILTSEKVIFMSLTLSSALSTSALHVVCVERLSFAVPFVGFCVAVADVM